MQPPLSPKNNNYEPHPIHSSSSLMEHVRRGSVGGLGAGGGGGAGLGGGRRGVHRRGGLVRDEAVEGDARSNVKDEDAQHEGEDAVAVARALILALVPRNVLEHESQEPNKGERVDEGVDGGAGLAHSNIHRVDDDAEAGEDAQTDDDEAVDPADALPLVTLEETVDKIVKSHLNVIF